MSFSLGIHFEFIEEVETLTIVRVECFSHSKVIAIDDSYHEVHASIYYNYDKEIKI